MQSQPNSGAVSWAFVDRCEFTLTAGKMAVGKGEPEGMVAAKSALGKGDLFNN